MKALKKSIFAFAAILMGVCMTACSDANEYGDANTTNPSMGDSHPESIENSTWVRAQGAKFNAYGEEIQGYVDTLKFISDTEVIVSMSEGKIPESMKPTKQMVDDSNNESNPTYEYTYNNINGEIDIQKVTVNSKGAVSKTTLFLGVAAGKYVVVSHFGDTPSQSYLVQVKE